MVPIFHGWNIVLVCLLIAVFGYGMGCYDPGIYLAALQALHGWSASLSTSAITGYSLLSATFIVRGTVGDHTRNGMPMNPRDKTLATTPALRDNAIVGMPANPAHRQISRCPKDDLPYEMDAAGVDAVVIHPPG